MGKGWIKLHRQLLDCWIWRDLEPFDKRSAWVDLLLAANHADKKVQYKGEIFIVQKGQMITSVRKLSGRWHWSTNRVYRYLKLLEQDGMIEKISDRNRTVLTIVNYGLYQLPDNANELENAMRGSQSSERDITKSMKSIKQQSTRPIYYPNNPQLEKAFQEYLTMRRAIKKPASTAMTLTRAKNTLEKLSCGDDELAIKILNQSTDNCWIGLFELKQEKPAKGNRNILDEWRQT